MNDTKTRHPRKSPRTSQYVIMSYGIILFTMVEGEPKFLIYQRRDNYEYIDIMRGNWPNETRLRELCSALSKEERQRLKEYSFRELWDDLWINHSSRIHTDGFDKAKKKYDMVRLKLPDIIDSTNASFNMEPPWGFPKGKKMDVKQEKDIDCALREFSEETHLPVDGVRVWDVRPYIEVYKGNNDKPYSTHYFLAEVSKEMEVVKIPTPGCIREEAVSEEAADARWVTCSEACLKLAPRRQTILKKITHLIRTKYQDLSPFADATDATES